MVSEAQRLVGNSLVLPFGSSLDCGEEAGRIGFHVDGRWAGRKKGRLARRL